MKSLKHYIKLVEAATNSPDHWGATIFVNYEFPNNVMIPQRVQQLEAAIDKVFKKYNFYMQGGGGGMGARDVSYGIEGPDLAQVLAVAKKALAEFDSLAEQIQDTLAKLGVDDGMELDASGFITDSDYEYNLSFDEAEEMVRQSQQLGKQ